MKKGGDKHQRPRFRWPVQERIFPFPAVSALAAVRLSSYILPRLRRASERRISQSGDVEIFHT
jgi:hypothetical protein